MKKLVLALSLLMAFQSVPVVFAASKDAKKKAETSDSALAKAEKERREELENTEWAAKFLPRDPKAKGPLEDKFVFKNGTVSLKLAEDKGFARAGYTLTAFPDSPRGTWETYQVAKQGEASLSMRGDWYGERMDGVVSMSFEKGKRVETYNFSTQKKSAIKPDEAAASATASQTPAQATPAKAPKSEGHVLVSKESVKK